MCAENGDVPRGCLTNAISEFVAATDKETRFPELLFGEDHGGGLHM